VQNTERELRKGRWGGIGLAPEAPREGRRRPPPPGTPQQHCGPMARASPCQAAAGTTRAACSAWSGCPLPEHASSSTHPAEPKGAGSPALLPPPGALLVLQRGQLAPYARLRALSDRAGKARRGGAGRQAPSARGGVCTPRERVPGVRTQACCLASLPVKPPRAALPAPAASERGPLPCCFLLCWIAGQALANPRPHPHHVLMSTVSASATLPAPGLYPASSKMRATSSESDTFCSWGPAASNQRGR
jgi:hypothetical protein